ncbi:Dynein light chain Tctex-type [Diplonema papillatum]|nr:Dynein light chain Tctex-type [Diplonema papillatum]
MAKIGQHVTVNDGHTAPPAADQHTTVKIYNPTFLMKPREGTKFLRRDVELAMNQVLQDKLANKTYDPNEQGQLSKEICTEIQSAVKKMGHERYKLVIQCNITEARGQGIRIASRCLWDPDQDNFAEVVFKSEHLWCSTLCFGCYWE